MGNDDINDIIILMMIIINIFSIVSIISIIITSYKVTMETSGEQYIIVRIM